MRKVSKALYKTETALRTKLEEVVLREKASNREKAAEVQRLEAEARRLKEEMEKERKEKTEKELVLMDEIHRREYHSTNQRII